MVVDRFAMISGICQVVYVCVLCVFRKFHQLINYSQITDNHIPRNVTKYCLFVLSTHQSVIHLLFKLFSSATAF